MYDLKVRHTIKSLFDIKLKIIENVYIMNDSAKNIDLLYKEINGYTPYRIEMNEHIYCDNRDEKIIDRSLWLYMVKLYNLEKFMSCSSYYDMLSEINNYKTPIFSIENAYGWVNSLKTTIRENVSDLIKKVYNDVTNSFYYTGNGYRGEKKKRNNNGIDKKFIIYTGDYSSINGIYYSNRPSIMDDLEKVCYILDGELLPDVTLRDTLKRENVYYGNNKYFSVKLCANGNTHFTINEEIRVMLNKYGSSQFDIGENIKIKIFSK